MTDDALMSAELASPEAAESDSANEGNQALFDARSSHPLEQQLEALLLVAAEPIGAVHLATSGQGWTPTALRSKRWP